jgi:putative nucleotidyltransferase with HDIG domain
MFPPFELSPRLRRKLATRNGRLDPATVSWDGSMSSVQLLQYLPLALFVTVSVIVLPAVLVAALTPRGGTLAIVASSALAVAGSVTLARVEASIWTRCPGSRDFTFADLMLWGWLRRCWADRRLAHTQALYEASRNAGLTVSIELVEELSERLAARDAYTYGHSQRVARHAERIAQAMHLTPGEIIKIRTAAMVHDVGKIYTPREVLNNPGRLSEREYAIVKLHVRDGADMLADVGDPEIAEIVRHHHEQVDGKGYPDGLAGLDIPLGARIIAVADTFDAITSTRPYRPAATHKRALDIIGSSVGSQLDDVVVAAFVESYSARRSVIWFSLAAILPQRLLLALQAASPGILTGSGATAGSLLPAVGAAGLLALSRNPSSAGNRSAVVRVYRPVANAPSRASTTSSAPRATGRTYRGGPRARIRIGSSQRPGGDGAPVSSPLDRSAPHNRQRSSTIPVTVLTGGTGESTSPKPSEAPPTSVQSPVAPTAPSSPTSPSAPPKSPSVPVEGSPKSPSLPSVPTVSVPSLPVTVPGLPVSIPSATESVAKLANSIVKATLGGET